MTKIIEIFNVVKSFIQSPQSVEKYRTSAKYFTRKSELTFEKTIYLMLCNFHNNLSVELTNTLIHSDLHIVTASAFRQRRYQIKHVFFDDLNDLFIESWFDPSQTDIKTWKGFRLQGVDGSKLTLPNNPAVREAFGTQIGGSKSVQTTTPMGLLLCQYDLLNKLIIKSTFGGLSIGEPTVMKGWLDSIKQGVLSVFDRGFFSYLLCYMMLEKKKDFVMRVKVNANKTIQDFVLSGKKEEILTFNHCEKQIFGDTVVPSQTNIIVRAIRVELKGGITEILITSLLDQQLYTIEDFNYVYALRWGIETCYDCLKNKLYLMCFTGVKPEAIRQEISATIVAHNLHQIIANEAQKEVTERVKKKTKRLKRNIHQQKLLIIS